MKISIFLAGLIVSMISITSCQSPVNEVGQLNAAVELPKEVALHENEVVQLSFLEYFAEIKQDVFSVNVEFNYFNEKNIEDKFLPQHISGKYLERIKSVDDSANPRVIPISRVLASEPMHLLIVAQKVKEVVKYYGLLYNSTTDQVIDHELLAWDFSNDQISERAYADITMNPQNISIIKFIHRCKALLPTGNANPCIDSAANVVIGIK